MGASARLSGFAAALALVFAGTWGAGAATTTARPTAASPVAAMTSDEGGPAPDHPASSGLAGSASGYTLAPQVATTFVPGAPAELAFAVTGLDGRPVTAFDPVDAQVMRLLVVRRDGAAFQRLQAVLGLDGIWRAPLTLPAAGVYRLYADFRPTGGPPLVLGADLFAPGAFVPVPFGPSRVAQVNGYQVRLDGDLVAAAPSQVFATVSRDGAPVVDLQPHAGAFAELVVLDQSDLALRRAQPAGPLPDATDRAGPAVAFTVTVPRSGSYRAFLTFRHGGAVHGVEFTVPTRQVP